MKVMNIFSVLMPEKWIFVKLFAEEKEKNLFNYLENSPEGGKNFSEKGLKIEESEIAQNFPLSFE